MGHGDASVLFVKPQNRPISSYNLVPREALDTGNRTHPLYMLVSLSRVTPLLVFRGSDQASQSYSDTLLNGMPNLAALGRKDDQDMLMLERLPNRS